MAAEPQSCHARTDEEIGQTIRAERILKEVCRDRACKHHGRVYWLRTSIDSGTALKKSQAMPNWVALEAERDPALEEEFSTTYPIFYRARSEFQGSRSSFTQEIPTATIGSMTREG
jgi:hypothetical protein